MFQITWTDPITGIQLHENLTEEQQLCLIELLKQEDPNDPVSESRINQILYLVLYERPQDLSDTNQTKTKL